MRVKDAKGEWLVYGVTLSGYIWDGNIVDFFFTIGKVTDGSKDGVPKWRKTINPATEEIDYGNTEILDHEKKYTVPFSKQRVNELIPFMQNRSFTVLMPDGKRQTCSEEQFLMSYAELTSQLSGWSDYIKARNKKYNGGN